MTVPYVKTNGVYKSIFSDGAMLGIMSQKKEEKEREEQASSERAANELFSQASAGDEQAAAQLAGISPELAIKSQEFISASRENHQAAQTEDAKEFLSLTSSIYDGGADGMVKGIDNMLATSTLIDNEDREELVNFRRMAADDPAKAYESLSNARRQAQARLGDAGVQQAQRLDNGYYQYIGADGATHLVSPDNREITDPQEVANIINQARQMKISDAREVSAARKEGELRERIEAEYQLKDKEQFAKDSAEFASKEPAIVRSVASTRDQLDAVKSMISRARELSSSLMAGQWAQSLSVLPGSDAKELKNLLHSIGSNVAFNELERLRKNSADGSSGLGPLTEREFAALEGKLGTLDTLDSDPSLQTTLDQIEYSMDRVMNDSISAYLISKERLGGERSLTDDQVKRLTGGYLVDEFRSGSKREVGRQFVPQSKKDEDKKDKSQPIRIITVP